jgi:hypothetical protein
MMNLRFLVIAMVAALPVAAQVAPKVVFFPAKQMDSDLHKLALNEIGESEINLIERTPGHAAILLRRTAPGKAEVHESQADAWYVIDGGCTFVAVRKARQEKFAAPELQVEKRDASPKATSSGYRQVSRTGLKRSREKRSFIS